MPPVSPSIRCRISAPAGERPSGVEGNERVCMENLPVLPSIIRTWSPRYVKVSGVWSYVYRAVDQHGQVIDGYVSQRRDIASARRFVTAALAVHGDPGEVITDRAPALANVVEELLPAAWHNTGQYENNRVECDHGRLKARLRSMRGLKHHRTASVVIRGHAFIQNLRRGHYELAVDTAPMFRVATAFDELRPAI